LSHFCSYASIVLVFAVLPPQEVYRPLKKNGLRSRDLQCFDGPSIRLECTCVLQTPTSSLSAAKASPCAVIRMFNHNSLVSISTPVAQSKQSQPRPSLPQPDALFTTSLSREVAYKYSLAAIADGGPHPSDWLSSVLKGGSVLYIESDQERWRLSAAAGGSSPLAIDVSICTQPLDFNSPTRLLHSAFPWQAMQWSSRGLKISGTNSGSSFGRSCYALAYIMVVGLDKVLLAFTLDLNSLHLTELTIKRFYWAASSQK
jgi:hypothetical protein